MKARRKSAWITLGIFLVALTGCRHEDPAQDPKLPWETSEVLRFYAPNFAMLKRQQDFYVIQVRNEVRHRVTTIVVDTGNYEEMRDYGLPYLKSHNIESIDELFITHPHKDHYGGLQALIESSVRVEKLYFNVPLKSSCDREIPWGCDFTHVQSIIEAAKSKGIEHREWFVDDPLQPNQILKVPSIEISLLWAPHGIHSELGVVDINDQSMVMRLTVSGTSYLLTGDLNAAGAVHIWSKLGTKLKSDILKVPHHAAESTAGNEFLSAVNPSVAIVPTHAELWCSDRSKRVRDLLQKSGAKTYTMDFSGDVIVRHFISGSPVWSIERQPSGTCLDGN